MKKYGRTNKFEQENAQTYCRLIAMAHLTKIDIENNDLCFAHQVSTTAIG